MLINEVCKECNLTKKAVEYYAEQGLIQPRITENGYRQFSETDALMLKRIAVLRGLGFSVPEIRTILENDSRTAIYDVLNRKELEIVELQTKQALICEAQHNSVAIPCVDFVMHCLVQAVQMSENIR